MWRSAELLLLTLLAGALHAQPGWTWTSLAPLPRPMANHAFCTATVNGDERAYAFMGITKMGVAAIFETRGNPDGHVILRGGRVPNYDAAGVDAACAALARAGLREQVMIDCSHANSAKRPERQLDVAADLAQRVAGGERRIVGVMVESHLHAGRQDLRPGRPLAYGVSITDACIGWDETQPMLRALAAAVAARRAG